MRRKNSDQFDDVTFHKPLTNITEAQNESLYNSNPGSPMPKSALERA